MPNRIIKESICTSNEIDCLTPEQETFFYRLIVNCDDYGRMDARLPILRAKCFPLRIDKIKDKDIQGWLNALVEQGLIYIYVVGERPYLQMSTWEKHQQIRAHKSKFPGPEEGMISSEINGNQENSDVPENPIQSESNPNTYTHDELEILETWNSFEITPHQQTEPMQKAIAKGLKKFGKDTLLTAIKNYTTIFADKQYFYKHKWRLDNFIDQKNGVPAFLPDGQTWINYEAEKKPPERGGPKHR